MNIFKYLMPDNPRMASLKVFYDGVDISADISGFITSFSYTERAKNGESDDLSITFQNIDKLWSTGWFPDRGAKIRAIIQTENWFERNDFNQLACGEFEIDDFTDSGPPAEFSIGALSVGITSSIRGEAKNKAWENIRISEVVREFSELHGFGSYFESDYDPVIDRFDQKGESDLEFLVKIAEYAGLQVRFSHGHIVVYREALYDSHAVAMTLKRNYDGIISHEFRASSADIYTACHVQYFDSKKNKVITYQYTPDGRSGIVGDEGQTSSGGGGGGQRIDPDTRMVVTDPPKSGQKTKTEPIAEPKVGKVLKISQRCTSIAEAEQLARSKLRGKNQQEITGSITLAGHLLLQAGLVIAVSGFGRWDTGTYSIDEVNHSYSKSSGLITTISLRGVLGY
ncbi:hypothetical protein I2492_09360 [Budviciaceae bacterium CWB-B4]|uniref:Phage protein D n=1 Tax=Limnobaculum xujianqingii TaxID=2738837 RepID=A0A9D7AI31_9GAMM|nr:contractile injection system protein, VgrG/Pvc8 family [Limnobaculum xujianqingii]MBK5073222.1 hypothetical protein [Limnobaculum xujianqingii]MBK5176531.1 hypothetical protein [Limnobaculum xujianqingii]